MRFKDGGRTRSSEPWWEVRKKEKGSPRPKSHAERTQPASLEGQGQRAALVREQGHKRAPESRVKQRPEWGCCPEGQIEEA